MLPAVLLSALLSVALVGGCASVQRPAPSAEAAPAAQAAVWPEPTRVVLPNGLTLLVVERHQQPIVSVSAVVRAGEAQDPAGRSGLAALTAELLRRGTTTRSAPVIAGAIDAVGGSLSAEAGLESSDVGLSVLKKDLHAGLDLMADVLLHPAFAPAELARLKEEHAAGLQAMLDDPDQVLRTAFTATIYGGNPYGRHETLSSLKALSRADVKAFYTRHYRPNNTFMAVVGDITPEEACVRFTKAFGAWARKPVPQDAAPAPVRATERRVVLVDAPLNQSYVRIGHVGVARNHPDYFPLMVMNYILGGDFTSRLNLSIRDRQGLAYGASSGLGMNLHGGSFSAAVNTKTESTGQALASLLAEIQTMQEQPVGAEELRIAKDYLTGSFPLRFETNGDLAREVVNIEFFGLPADYLQTYRAKLESVSAADVQRVARAYLDPAQAAVVVVGSGAAVEPVLATYGPVKRLEKAALIK